ncbi:hypothetical protein Cni_G28556 [Canna indica]|uniref:Uncharacterized protein n=1 Tax=Canna indica TaxID=4628 RepID=A0AAQ3QQD9_9LILI|nr:hypothetical protein Cni_G28556 [Canna indica]
MSGFLFSPASSIISSVKCFLLKNIYYPSREKGYHKAASTGRELIEVPVINFRCTVRRCSSREKNLELLISCFVTTWKAIESCNGFSGIRCIHMVQVPPQISTAQLSLVYYIS